MIKNKTVKYKRPLNYKTRKDKDVPRGLSPRTISELKMRKTPLARYLIEIDKNMNVVTAKMGIGIQTLHRWLFAGIEPRMGIDHPVKYIAATLNLQESEVFEKLSSSKTREIDSKTAISK